MISAKSDLVSLRGVRDAAIPYTNDRDCRALIERLRMRLVATDNKITLDELRTLAQERYGDFVKVVVDNERGGMVVGMEFHADGEAHFLEQGSKQEHLWGINLHPDASQEERIEFNSMINLRPASGNHSRGVDNPEIHARIVEVVASLIS